MDDNFRKMWEDAFSYKVEPNNSNFSFNGKYRPWWYSNEYTRAYLLGWRTGEAKPNGFNSRANRARQNLNYRFSIMNRANKLCVMGKHIFPCETVEILEFTPNNK